MPTFKDKDETKLQASVVWPGILAIIGIAGLFTLLLWLTLEEGASTQSLYVPTTLFLLVTISWFLLYNRLRQRHAATLPVLSYDGNNFLIDEKPVTVQAIFIDKKRHASLLGNTTQKTRVASIYKEIEKSRNNSAYVSDVGQASRELALAWQELTLLDIIGEVCPATRVTDIKGLKKLLTELGYENKKQQWSSLCTLYERPRRQTYK